MSRIYVIIQGSGGQLRAYDVGGNFLWSQNLGVSLMGNAKILVNNNEDVYVMVYDDFVFSRTTFVTAYDKDGNPLTGWTNISFNSSMTSDQQVSFDENFDLHITFCQFGSFRYVKVNGVTGAMEFSVPGLSCQTGVSPLPNQEMALHLFDRIHVYDLNGNFSREEFFTTQIQVNQIVRFIKVLKNQNIIYAVPFSRSSNFDNFFITDDQFNVLTETQFYGNTTLNVQINSLKFDTQENMIMNFSAGDMSLYKLDANFNQILAINMENINSNYGSFMTNVGNLVVNLEDDSIFTANGTAFIKLDNNGNVLFNINLTSNARAIGIRETVDLGPSYRINFNSKQVINIIKDGKEITQIYKGPTLLS